MYLVVEFTDDKETAVIPSTWLEGNMCAVWPPFKNTTKITNAAKDKIPPGANWKAYPIRELYRNGMYSQHFCNTITGMMYTNAQNFIFKCLKTFLQNLNYLY